MLSNTDGQSHKQITLYHIPMGMGDILFSIQISTFSLTVFACLLCFVQDKLILMSIPFLKLTLSQSSKCRDITIVLINYFQYH